MLSVKTILGATIATLALAAPPAQRDAGHQNCLADVIHARGIEMKGLERRASWSYEAEFPTGAASAQPAKRGKLKNVEGSNLTVATREYQSPINFEGEELLIDQKPSLSWASLTTPFEFLNNGHTVQLQLKQSTPALLSHEVNGIDYTVQQVHFHSPSEHHVDEKYFPLEAHFVHASADVKLNVIGVFFEIGAENPWIAQFVDNIPLTTNATTQIPSLDLSSIISALGASKYFSYSGSLTTPPCTEGVLWLVAQEPLKISQAQLDKLTKVMPFNSRTTQANKSGEKYEAGHETKNETVYEAPVASKSVAPVVPATGLYSSAQGLAAATFVAAFATLML
ncbi:UNVERIFIED_CONTAM: hypothetical protein HDU68_001364 [Siphonaria sp. JEL0065]|nr:hypothetical protein HDU68_001364 [Siphonaria sp. JEL0065]